VEFFFTCGQLKKIKNEIKMPTQRQISESAELDGRGGFSGKFCFLRGRKPNRKFYRGENRK